MAHDPVSLKRLVFPTDLGWMALLASSAGVRKLTFDHPSASRARSAVTAGIEQAWEDSDEDLPVARLLCDYAAGRPVDFSRVALDLPRGTPFQERVIAGCRRIPFGETLSYGELAQRAGSPGAARAVGNIMKANTVPLVVPCHRVLAAGGRIGGYSAPGGLCVKERLLALEAGHDPRPKRARAKRKVSAIGRR